MPDPFQGPFPVSTQEFELEGKKLKSSKGYLRVESIGTANVSVINTTDGLAATDFYRNLSKVSIDSNGRLFYIGKFYDKSWGSADLAEVALSYGGESYLDYMPVLGTTTQGHAIVTASLFDSSTDVMRSD